MTDTQGDTPKSSLPSPQGGLGKVFDALKTLKFGAIQLTVHDGKLVQVDVTERHRYPN